MNCIKFWCYKNKFKINTYIVRYLEYFMVLVPLLCNSHISSAQEKKHRQVETASDTRATLLKYILASNTVFLAYQ